MRNFFALMLAAMSLFAMSCEPKINPVEDVKLEITSEAVVNVDAAGGLVNISFTLGGGDYTLVQATADNDDMITAINTDDLGFVRVMVAANPTLSEREARVCITFEGESEYVTIRQAADMGGTGSEEMINIEANTLIGVYYGERYVAGQGHYWIILSKDGYADGATLPNSEYFRLDVLAPTAADDVDVMLPDGVYRYDPSNSFDTYTMPDFGSTDYAYTDESGEGWTLAFEDAELTVNGSSLRLVAHVDGKVFNVTFNGTYALDRRVQSDTISTLTEDYDIDLSRCDGTASCYQDYWECGCCNWQIEFVDRTGLTNGVYLVLDFLTDDKIDGSSGIAGTYHCTGFTVEDPTKPDFRSYTFMPGIRISDAGHMMGSLLQIYENGKGVHEAPISDGVMTITDNGNGTHTIVIDGVDDAEPAHKITLNWTGRLK